MSCNLFCYCNEQYRDLACCLLVVFSRSNWFLDKFGLSTFEKDRQTIQIVNIH